VGKKVLNSLLEEIVIHYKPRRNHTQEQNHQGYGYYEGVSPISVVSDVDLNIFKGYVTYTVESFRYHFEIYVHKHKSLWKFTIILQNKNKSRKKLIITKIIS